jgi:hypothetical protein
LVGASPATWLAVCGALVTAIFYFAFTARYGLDEYKNSPWQTIATLNRLSADGAFIYVAAFLALFGLYAFGARQVMRLARDPRDWTAWLLIGGMALAFNVALLRMYPADAADTYDYIIRGRMASVYGLNPMQDPPNRVRTDPFFRFAAWPDVTSAYGPAWEIVAGLVTRLAGDDHVANVVLFKFVAMVGYAAAALFLGMTLARLAPRRLLLGVYLFAWNPLVVYMTGRTGHNDTLMTAFLMLGVYCLARRWYVAGTLSALVGVMIKFIPALLIPIIAAVALRELSARLRIRYVLASALLGGAILLALYAPYGLTGDVFSLSRRSGMFTGSAATLLRQTLIPALDNKPSEGWEVDTPVTNRVVSNGAWALLALVYAAQLWNAYQDRDPIAPFRALTVILTFYLLVACIWFQSWYALWIVALAALLENGPLRRLVLWFSYLVTWQSFLYNYVTLRPGLEGWAPLPWRDLVPVGVVIGGAWLYVGWYWLSTWLRGLVRTPEAAAAGARLRVAREAAGLSAAALCDELDLRIDDLLACERGDKTLPLAQIQALCTRLGLTLADLSAPVEETSAERFAAQGVAPAELSGN